MWETLIIFAWSVNTTTDYYFLPSLLVTHVCSISLSLLLSLFMSSYILLSLLFSSIYIFSFWSSNKLKGRIGSVYILSFSLLKINNFVCVCRGVGVNPSDFFSFFKIQLPKQKCPFVKAFFHVQNTGLLALNPAKDRYMYMYIHEGLHEWTNKMEQGGSSRYCNLHLCN